MIEDELRAAFARHEDITPQLGALRKAIDKAAARRRQKHWGVSAGATAIAVVVAMFAIPVLLAQAPVQVQTLIGTKPTPPTGPLNFLLLGLDGGRSAESGTSGNRADSITVVHIPADRSRLYLVSLPRDLKVQIPGHGRGKLNDTSYFGGQRLTTGVVEQLTGVKMDGTVTANLPAIRQITDAVGGVRVCLPAPVRSLHRGVTYPRGCREFTGEEVCDLLRQRKHLPLGALDRDDNAQRVMAALLEASTDLDVVQLSQLVQIKGVTVDLAGHGLASLLSLLDEVDVSAAVGLGQPSFSSELVDGRGYEVLMQPAAGDLFQALRQDTVDEFVVAHPQWVTAMR